jgi:hypothetical protein
VDDGNVPAVTRPGETTMKMYLRALAVAAVLIVPTLAVADDTTLVQAFVPFEFTVGTTTLPAGTYRISRQFGAQDLLVVDGKGERVLLFASRLETPPARNAETHLTFQPLRRQLLPECGTTVVGHRLHPAQGVHGARTRQAAQQRSAGDDSDARPERSGEERPAAAMSRPEPQCEGECGPGRRHSCSRCQ